MTPDAGQLDLLAFIPQRVEELHYGAPTSARAAKKASLKAGSNAFRILEYLDANGPATPDEVAKAIGLSPWQVRPRFSVPLLENRWIRDTGLERTTTALGGEQYLCCITESGRAVLRGGADG